MKPQALPLGYEEFTADALHDAMLARDVPRCIEIGKLAAELVKIDLEQARRAQRSATKGDR